MKMPPGTVFRYHDSVNSWLWDGRYCTSLAAGIVIRVLFESYDFEPQSTHHKLLPEEWAS